MTKLILFYNFFIVTLFTVAGFSVAKSSHQIFISLLFVPMAIYFFRQFFTGRFPVMPPLAKNLLPYTYHPPAQTGDTLLSPGQGSPLQGEELSALEVSDINRRLFLKLIGTAGITTFLFALFTKQSHAAFFGSVPGPGTVSIKDSQGKKIDPAEKGPTDGYEISQIDDTTIPAYYGFVNKDGGWYIAREGNGGEYRYLKGSSNFEDNWTTRALSTFGLFNDIF